MLDIVLSAVAAMKEKGFLFRKAYTEWDDAKKMFAKDNASKEKAETDLRDLIRAFKEEEANYPVECKRIDMRYAAEVAGSPHIYEIAYRTYCEFTHSSMRAIHGHLDEATDPVDTSIVIWSVMTMLESLQKHTPAEVPNLASFISRWERNNMLEGP